MATAARILAEFVIDVFALPGLALNASGADDGVRE